MAGLQLAVFVVMVGFLGGACGTSTSQNLNDRDADVADLSGSDASMAGAGDAGPGNEHPRAGKIACEDQPTEGEACDPLPAGFRCRQGSCPGGCSPECQCTDGTWHCSVTCRDSFSPLPVECGTPPLCRDECVPVPILPDGGLGPVDGPITVGYRYPLRFTPPDLTTLWGDQPLALVIDNGPALDETWLAELAAQTTLRTWPELELVPADIAPQTTADGSSPNGAQIVVTPRSKLEDRWYALHIAALPFWVAAMKSVEPDGSYVSRFRTGSEPHVASVTFAGGATKHRLYIGTSESVAANSSPSQFIQVRHGGELVPCSDVAFTPGRALNIISFDCPSLSEFPDQISIGAGLVSTTGAALLPIVVEKVVLTLTSCGQSCEQVNLP